jgi:hypothetical protein
MRCDYAACDEFVTAATRSGCGTVPAGDTWKVRALPVTACAATLVLASSLAAPPAAGMSCAAAVVVDRVVLFGASLAHSPGGGVLPARGSRLSAIVPACGDDDEDRRTTVRSLAGVPARVAVAGVGNDSDVYLARGSVVALRRHPLHDTFYGDASKPSVRGVRSCRPGGTLHGTVTYPGGTHIVLSTRASERIVRVDASSRITNRPSYQPVLPRQRLRLSTSRCGSRRVAERITFMGATVQPERYDGRSNDDGGVPWVLVVAAGIAAIGVALIIRSRSLLCAVSALVAVGLLASLPAPAAAQGMGLRQLTGAPRGIDAVAYAGTERLYATGRALMRLGPDGHARRVARLRGTASQLAASHVMVALIERRGTARRLLAGPPAGPLRTLARCRGSRPEIPYSPLAVAGGAIAEALSCRPGASNGAASFRVHEGGAVRVVPAPPGTRVIALAGAPGRLAVATQDASLRGPVRVEVSDARTGALRYAVGGLPEPIVSEPLDLREDGVAVFCGRNERLAWASPAEPSAHPIGQAVCPTELALAGNSVAYIDEGADALRVVELSGRVRTLVRPSGDIPFDWDGTRVLVRGLGCREDFLGDIGLVTAPHRGRACHVRILRVARGRGRGVVRVSVACRPGCRGDVQLLLGRGGGYYDRAPLRLRQRGRRAVRVQLGARAQRLLRRYRSVPFHAAVSYVNPADGAGGEPIVERSGVLAGDGPRRFPPGRGRHVSPAS